MCVRASNLDRFGVYFPFGHHRIDVRSARMWFILAYFSGPVICGGKTTPLGTAFGAINLERLQLVSLDSVSRDCVTSGKLLLICQRFDSLWRLLQGSYEMSNYSFVPSVLPTLDSSHIQITKKTQSTFPNPNNIMPDEECLSGARSRNCSSVPLFFWQPRTRTEPIWMHSLPNVNGLCKLRPQSFVIG